MHFFEFLHPDKSPPNARMPKRKKAKNLQKEQTTHTPHPHNKIPPKFPRMPPKFRQNHDCTLQVFLVHRCQVSAHPNLHPEVSQCAKIQGLGHLKRPSKFPYTHEVREFLTIQRPNAPDQTPTPHPRSISGSLIASKIPHLSRENFTPWGSRPTHRPRHRERAVIRLCACRKMPNTLADANLP